MQFTAYARSVIICCKLFFFTKLIIYVMYVSVSQPLWDRGPVNSFFIRRGPGPNKFTRK